MSLLLPGLAFITGVVWAAVARFARPGMSVSDVDARHAGLHLGALVELPLAALVLVCALVVLVRRPNSRTSPASSCATRPLLAAMALALLAGRVHGALVFTESVDVWWPPHVGVIDLVVDGASEPGARCSVEAHPRAAASTVLSARRSLVIELPMEACPLAQGDVIGIPGAALRRGPEPPRWLESPGAAALGDRVGLRADLWFRRGLERGGVSGWSRGYWLAIARTRQALLDAARGDEARSLVVASTLGQRSALPEAATVSLRRAGLWHIVSVSGLHVAVASVLALAFGLRLCAVAGLPVTWAVMGAWGLVGVYVALTGASAPAVRAGMMSAWFGVGIVLGRPVHGVTTLVLALATMLIFRPIWIVEPGFQLSAVAMAALVTGDRHAGVVAQSWRLTWALAPLCLWWFGSLPLVGVLLNVIAVPVFTIVVLPAGLVGGLLVPWWGGASLDVAAAGARLVLDLAELAAKLPPAGTRATAGLAGVLLLHGEWRRWRSPSWVLTPRDVRERPLLGLPRRFSDGLASAPTMALVAVLVVAWGCSPTTPLDHPALSTRVYAIGDATHRAVLIARPGGGTCIDVSRAASLPLPRWLDALGLHRPWIVVGEDPASVAARDRLTALPDDGRCMRSVAAFEGASSRIGGTLRSCRRLGNDAPAIVRTEHVTGRWSCAMSSGWRATP